MRRLHVWTIALAALAVASGTALAQERQVTGTVTRASDGQPIAEARQVRIRDHADLHVSRTLRSPRRQEEEKTGLRPTPISCPPPPRHGRSPVSRDRGATHWHPGRIIIMRAAAPEESRSDRAPGVEGKKGDC